MRQSERDAGRRPGLSINERMRLKELERENRELRRADEILRKASAYFAAAARACRSCTCSRSYYEDFPKPRSGGWGRRTIVIAPDGEVMPCHAAAEIPGLEFASGPDYTLEWIWTASPAFNRFRGTDWMPEPCRSCPREEADFGGCRCQALLLTGDAAATDPVCHLWPQHHLVAEARDWVARTPLPSQG